LLPIHVSTFSLEYLSHLPPKCCVAYSSLSLFLLFFPHHPPECLSFCFRNYLPEYQSEYLPTFCLQKRMWCPRAPLSECVPFSPSECVPVFLSECVLIFSPEYLSSAEDEANSTAPPDLREDGEAWLLLLVKLIKNWVTSECPNLPPHTHQV
jgi:hypothetical protein